MPTVLSENAATALKLLRRVANERGAKNGAPTWRFHDVAAPIFGCSMIAILEELERADLIRPGFIASAQTAMYLLVEPAEPSPAE